MQRRQVRKLLDGMMKVAQDRADNIDSQKLLGLWIAWLNLSVKEPELDGLPSLVLMKEFKKDRKLINQVRRIVNDYDGEIIT